MQLIKIAMAKELFQAGAFDEAMIGPAPMEDGHILVFAKNGIGRILSNDKGSTRIFKTIETARKTAKEMGFHKITLI